MENQEKENKEIDGLIDERKEKIKNWLKNHYNLTLAIVFLSIIALRFYYFWMTKNQAVWWDESEYLSAAKSYAGIVDYKLHEIRLPGLPALISVFYILGIVQESIIRFFVGFIPSIILLFVFYFLIKEMYQDKRIALISLIILGVLWENLFYSNRFHTENLSIIFEFLAILILFKVYMKREKLGIITPKFSLLWIIIFSGLSFFMRSGNVLFFPVVVFFIIFLNQYFLFQKNKILSYSFAIFIIIIISLLFFNIKAIPIIKIAYHPDFPVTFSPLKVFNGFFESVIPKIPPVFLYAFFIGLILSVINLFLIADKIKNICRDSNCLDFKSDIFNLALLFSVLSAFIFILRASNIEFRWFFVILPPILAFTGKGIISFSEFAGDFIKNKRIVLLIILMILFFGAYNQIAHADSIIKNKLNTYYQVKEAGLWMKGNSEPEDIIVSASIPQNTFYSERKTIPYANSTGGPITEEKFIELLKIEKPKYLTISVFEPSVPQWSYSFPEKYKNTLSPVQAYFADAANTQPILVIYEFKNYDFKLN